MPKLRSAATVAAAVAIEAAEALVEIPAVDSAEAAVTSVVDLQADSVVAVLVVDLQADSAVDHQVDLEEDSVVGLQAASVDLAGEDSVGDLRAEVVR
jgi:hypothetical protein